MAPGIREAARIARPKLSEVDLSRRADPAEFPELMDEPCSYEEFRACVRGIGSVNRWTLAYRPTLRFLERLVAQCGKVDLAQGQPLRIVDVGSGGGDALRRIALWARRRNVSVHLTGIDLNPHATRAAQEFSAQDSRFGAIRWITGDVFREPAAQGCDVVLSSLVTHHMRDAEIMRFLRWMEASATRGWFINDLSRSRKAYAFFRAWAPLMRWHPFVQHDGLVSIRRAFRTEDWHRLLAAAGISSSAVRLSQPVPGRLCVARLR